MAARQASRRGTKRSQGAGWRIPMVIQRQRTAGWRATQGMFAARGRRAVNAGAGAELKFHDIDWDEAVADMSAGLISNTSSLVFIGQGVTESTRIGRKCVIRSIGWRGKVELIAGATASLTDGQVVRLLLVQDKQANGAAPSVSGTNGLLQSANYQSFNDLSNKSRFTVLMDRTFDLNLQAAAGDGAVNDSANVKESFTFFKKCNIAMEYSGVANPSVIGEVRTNNIFGIIITEESTQSITLDSKLRFRFSDG